MLLTVIKQYICDILSAPPNPKNLCYKRFMHVASAVLLFLASCPRDDPAPGESVHLQPRLVDDVQQVLGVDGERVSRGQHLLLVVLLQAGQDVLLRQTHLTDELRQVRVQQLLSHLDLTQTHHTQHTSS